MPANKYMVLCDRVVVARDMELETALMLVEAMFEKYWNERAFALEIKRESPEEMAETHKICTDTHACVKAEQNADCSWK